MNNNEFNIINQLTQEQKSLWRIERLYISEAQSAEERNMWEAMKASKEEQVAKLKEAVQKLLL